MAAAEEIGLDNHILRLVEMAVASRRSISCTAAE